MIVLFDTNVILDVLLEREPHAASAARLFAAVETGIISGMVGATTVTAVYYLAAKTVGTKRARTAVSRLLKLFNVAPVTRLVLEDALARKGFMDFEDAVLHESARHSEADAIVTRNTRDFAPASLRIHSPDDLLRVLKAAADEEA